MCSKVDGSPSNVTTTNQIKIFAWPRDLVELINVLEGAKDALQDQETCKAFYASTIKG